MGWTNSTETGVWAHISQSERSGLPLSPRLLSVTFTSQTYTNTAMAKALMPLSWHINCQEGHISDNFPSISGPKSHLSSFNSDA